MIRASAVFFVGSLGLIVLVGWLLGFVWSDPPSRHAVMVSGEVAFVVQLFTFAVARLAAPANVMSGWGIGVLMRFLAMVVYALFAAKALELPLAPALLSLVAFFFVTSLLEPVLLKR